MTPKFNPHTLSPQELRAAHEAYTALGVIVARTVAGYARLEPVFKREDGK